MRQPDFHININEIIVHGCGQISEHELHVAIQTELQSLISTAELSPCTHSVDHRMVLDGGTMSISATPDTAALGTQIAQAIFKGVQG